MLHCLSMQDSIPFFVKVLSRRCVICSSSLASRSTQDVPRSQKHLCSRAIVPLFRQRGGLGLRGLITSPTFHLQMLGMCISQSDRSRNRRSRHDTLHTKHASLEGFATPAEWSRSQSRARRWLLFPLLGRNPVSLSIWHIWHEPQALHRDMSLHLLGLVVIYTTFSRRSG